MDSKRYQLWMENMNTGETLLVGTLGVNMDHAWACRFKRACDVGRKWQRFYLVEVAA